MSWPGLVYLLSLQQQVVFTHCYSSRTCLIMSNTDFSIGCISNSKPMKDTLTWTSQTHLTCVMYMKSHDGRGSASHTESHGWVTSRPVSVPQCPTSCPSGLSGHSGLPGMKVTTSVLCVQYSLNLCHQYEQFWPYVVYCELFIYEE